MCMQSDGELRLVVGTQLVDVSSALCFNLGVALLSAVGTVIRVELFF